MKPKTKKEYDAAMRMLRDVTKNMADAMYQGAMIAQNDPGVPLERKVEYIEQRMLSAVAPQVHILAELIVEIFYEYKDGEDFLTQRLWGVNKLTF